MLIEVTENCYVNGDNIKTIVKHTSSPIYRVTYIDGSIDIVTLKEGNKIIHAMMEGHNVQTT